MKRNKPCYIAFLPALLFSMSCRHSGKINCSALKHGKFYYKGPTPSKGSIIQREDSIQTVTDQETGTQLKEKLTWVDPCSYVLSPFPDNQDEILKSDLFPLKVSILKVTDRYYTVHVVSWNQRSEFRDTAWIMGSP